MRRSPQRLIVSGGVLAGLVLAAVGLLTVASGVDRSTLPVRVPGPASWVGLVLLSDAFPGPNGPGSLITNEYAFVELGGVRSDVWEVTSGSLFWRAGAGWTGRPSADCSPDLDSTPCTNSGVFRLRTRRADFVDARLDINLRVNALTEVADATSSDGEGVSLWLRYGPDRASSSEGTDLYKFEVTRRDGAVAIKKKCYDPDEGADNQGKYYELGRRERQPIAYGRWQQVGASARNAAGGVTLRLSRGGDILLEATDRGTGCAPFRGPGRAGVRGDDADFEIDDVRVTALPWVP